jgi:Ran GTPase-activating protein (RanGAP) involved in mRNA processing and transport
MVKKGKGKKKKKAKQIVPPGVSAENVVSDYISICAGINIEANPGIAETFVLREDMLQPVCLEVKPYWEEGSAEPIGLGPGGCRALIGSITKKEVAPFQRPKGYQYWESERTKGKDGKAHYMHLSTGGFWFCSPGEPISHGKKGKKGKAACAFCEKGQGPFYPSQIRSWADAEDAVLPANTLIAHSETGRPPGEGEYMSLERRKKEQTTVFSRLKEKENFFNHCGQLFGAPYTLLTELKLNECAIGTNGAIYVSSLLRPGNGLQLQVLELRDNGIELEGFIQLADALISNESLHTLVLDSNQGMNDWACKILSRAITLKSGLLKLSLQDCVIGVDGCIGLAKMLKQTPSKLEVLSLLGNNLTPMGLLALCEGLEAHASMTTLNLKGTGIGKISSLNALNGLQERVDKPVVPEYPRLKLLDRPATAPVGGRLAVGTGRLVEDKGREDRLGHRQANDRDHGVVPVRPTAPSQSKWGGNKEMRITHGRVAKHSTGEEGESEVGKRGGGGDGEGERWEGGDGDCGEEERERAEKVAPVGGVDASSSGGGSPRIEGLKRMKVGAWVTPELRARAKMTQAILALQKVLIQNRKLVHVDLQTNCIGEECGNYLLSAITERKRLKSPMETFKVDSTFSYDLFKKLWHLPGKGKKGKRKGGKKKKKR